MRLPRRPGSPARGDELIDRDPQNLPLPVGGFRVTRRTRLPSVTGRWWRRNNTRVLAAAGVTLALVGGLLALTRPPVAVGMEAGGVRVGTAVLPIAGDAAHFGGGTVPAYVLTHVADGSTVGTASGSFSGQHFTGSCTVREDATGLQETCRFTLGQSAFSSTDQLVARNGPQWERRYSDGQGVSIAVPTNGGVVPVAFPIGR